MFRTFQLFTFRGIPIRVHGTLIVMLILLGLAWSVGSGLSGFLLTLLMLVLIFGFVLLHEMGHSVVALHHGIGVRSITLYPLGGIASLVRMPRNPRTEFQIAIAGPLVNIALAGLFALLRWLYPMALLDPLVHVNLALALFNLLPAFPLDGGRILRAFLAVRMPHAEATRVAARTGQVSAVVLGLVGLFTLHLMLMFIAVFIFFAAQAELMAALARSRPESSWFEARFPEDTARSRRESFTSPGPFGPSEPPESHRRRGADSRGASRAAGGTDQDRTVIEILPDGRVRRYTRE